MPPYDEVHPSTMNLNRALRSRASGPSTRSHVKKECNNCHKISSDIHISGPRATRDICEHCGKRRDCGSGVRRRGKKEILTTRAANRLRHKERWKTRTDNSRGKLGHTEQTREIFANRTRRPLLPLAMMAPRALGLTQNQNTLNDPIRGFQRLSRASQISEHIRTSSQLLKYGDNTRGSGQPTSSAAVEEQRAAKTLLKFRHGATEMELEDNGSCAKNRYIRSEAEVQAAIALMILRYGPQTPSGVLNFDRNESFRA